MQQHEEAEESLNSCEGHMQAIVEVEVEETPLSSNPMSTGSRAACEQHACTEAQIPEVLE